MIPPVPVDTWANQLHLATVVFNPLRYQSRYDLYWRFWHHMQASGVTLYTAEIAVGERSFHVTEPGNPLHLQLWSNQMLWHKETAINLMIQRIPPEAISLGWIDADITLARYDWASEAVHQLQIHPVVQLWSEAIDLTPGYEPLSRHKSFAWSYHNLTPDPTHDPYQPPKPSPRWIPWHPGYGWAYTRDAWNQLGGMIDSAILGAADNQMAKSLIGDGQYSMHPKVSHGYKQVTLDWQKRAEPLHRDLGYVEGLLLHHWHGKKAARGYWDRWQVLVQSQFDPRTDLQRDAQGLWQLVVTNHRQRKLRDALRKYFKSRNEDGIDYDLKEGNMA